MLTMTLTDPHDAFEGFYAPVFCDFIQNNSGTCIVTLNSIFCPSGIVHLVVLTSYFLLRDHPFMTAHIVEFQL